MIAATFRTLLLLILVAVAAPGVTLARDLTFEDRVAAQEAIERVYYSHQVGAIRPFEEAVPRSLLETKVRRYLKQTAALDEFWKNPVTDQMLGRELERMAMGTKLPERLIELYAALGNDPFLIKECLARPILVERLSRNFFAFDTTIHGDARRQAEEMRRRLAEGEVDAWQDHPARSVVEIASREPGDKAREEERGPQAQRKEGEPARLDLSPGEYRKHRAQWPRAVGEAATVEENRDAFVVRVVLKDTGDGMRGAVYSVRKRTWEDWWREVEGSFESEGIEPSAQGGGHVPLPDSRPKPSFDTDGGAVESASSPMALTGSSCDNDNTWDTGILDLLIDQRYRHTAVWTGTLMIVWGGFGVDGYLNTGGRYDPATDSWTRTSLAGAPSPRTNHTAVWTGSLMVVWGGYPYLDTGGRYNPATDAWTPTSTTNAPAGRSLHTAVWTGSLMVVWGGGPNTGGRYNPGTDTWAPTSTIDAPAGRWSHTAVWTGSVMVVWGGTDNVGYFFDGGRYNPVTDTWTPVSLVGAPEPRSAHTAIWMGSLMVIWGGTDSLGSYFNSGGRYNPATNTWAPTSITNAPAGRWSHTAIWTGSLMVIWGGTSNSSNSFDTGGRYNPTTNTWTATSTTTAPSGRLEHTAVWTGSLMVVWGGYNHYSYFNTGGRYNPATNTWTATSLGGDPTARWNHTAVWTGSLMVVWGGTDGAGYFNTGGRYDPATDSWTSTSTANAPGGRSFHTVVWTGSLMVVWGGYDGSGPLNTGGRYDPAADTWTAASTTNAPSGRWFHTVVWTGSLMVIWGGYDGSSFLTTGGRYNPSSDTWTPTSTTNVPEGREKHTAVWTGSLMVVWGGYNIASGYLPTGGRYDPAMDIWTPTAIHYNPAFGHTAVWTGSLMIVFGGETYFGDTAWGARYNPATDSWTEMSISLLQMLRQHHTAIWTGSVMVVWGGYNPAYGNQDSGGRYDPATNTWTFTSTTNAPGRRGFHTAVWTGSLMMVWGGSDGAALLNTGGGFVSRDLSNNDGDGYSVCAGDCDDTHANVYPGAPQICDGLNNDCNAPGWPSLAGINEGDADGDTFSVCQADCDDLNSATFPGAPQLCDGINNNCSDASWPAAPANEADVDGDGSRICAGDCNDADPSIFPNAVESNDGQDNQCPANPGFGIIDEVSGALTFSNPADRNEISWPAQPGGTAYELIRAISPHFPPTCGDQITQTLSWSDAAIPGPGGVYYYLLRSIAPYVGSWGQNSSGEERAGLCGAESNCADGQDNDGDGRTDCADLDCFQDAACAPATFTFLDTFGDDIAPTSLTDFFSSITPATADYILFSISGSGFVDFKWCSERADFYRDNYLAMAASGGSVISGTWNRWSHLEGGAWVGPDTTGYLNSYSGDCVDNYSWCTESGLAGRSITILPDQTGECEAFDLSIGCGPGDWTLTIKIGSDRLRACGF